MEPQENDESPHQMKDLATLSPEAQAILEKYEEDGFSFKDLLPNKYWEMAGRHIYFPLDPEGLSDYVGKDAKAPLGAKTPCVVCIANMVGNLAKERHPENEKLQHLIDRWAELEGEAAKTSFPRKRPSEIIEMKKEFYRTISFWTAFEIRGLQKIFLEILESLGEKPETHFIPRYIARIRMRESDGESIGEIQKKGESDIRGGSFVAVSVSPMTCFNRIVFTLGLKPGYHALAGCGNSDHPESHLYQLRNVRMKLKDDIHRGNQRGFEKFGLLYAQTYEAAEAIKKLNDAEPGEFQTLGECWFSNPSKPRIKLPETVWVTGSDMDKKLETHDHSIRHTMRMVTFAPSIDGTWDLVMVVERGDQKTGGKSTERTGKPPGLGIPGGQVEKQEVLGATALREFSNEAQTMSSKILGLFAETRKGRIPGATMDNVDHWLVALADREACSTKGLVERPEIYKVYRIKLDQLATFGFQDTKRAVWDLDRVDRCRLLYPNHASHLVAGLPLIVEKGIFPGLKLPDNFQQFKDNLVNFLEKKAGYR